MDKAQARQRVLALFTTLANGKAVVSDWGKAQRSGEIRDVFEILDTPYTRAVCGGKTLTMRIDRRKNDVVTKGRPEMCSWSVDALTGYAQAMSDEEIAHLDNPCERLAAVQKVTRILDTGNGKINGRPVTGAWTDPEGTGDERWVIWGSEDYSADELLNVPLS